MVCVTNRPIIITIIVEAEYDVTNYADRGGCYPPKKIQLYILGITSS